MNFIKTILGRIIVLSICVIAFILLAFLSKNDGNIAAMWKDILLLITTGKVS